MSHMRTKVVGAIALVGLACATYAGVTTNCFNWAGPCPDTHPECCERTDSGQNQAYCKQLCAPYSDIGCCKWTGRWFYYVPVGSGCCGEVNDGIPNCWVITNADNMGDSFACVKQGEIQPCNTNTQFGSCLAKSGLGDPGS